MAHAFEVPTRRLPVTSILVFVILTFLVTWGVIGSYILWPGAMGARFGAVSGSHPFYFLATWSPAIAGFAVVLFYGGRGGLMRFLSRLLFLRCPTPWWLFILVGIPLVFMTGSLIKGGPLIVAIPPEGAGAMVGLIFMMLFLGPIEEFGWRGVAQPLLQRYMAPFWAGLLIGTVWGIWHLPAFYLAGVIYENWSFLPFVFGDITLAVLVTPIFNASRGSILLPMLFHWQLINPFWPDAQPWDSWILVVVAAVIVWWKRDEMFSSDGAVTEVIPEDARP